MHKWILRFISIGFAVAAGICFSVESQQIDSSPEFAQSTASLSH